jgi:hypothetical protein
MHGHFAQLLGAAVAEPEAQLNALEMFSEAEKQERVAKKQARENSNAGKLRKVKRKTPDKLTIEPSHITAATA